MYRIRSKNGSIGAGGYEVAVPLPSDHATWLERCRLRWGGFVDRFRNRGVDDLRHTHYLHSLQRQARRMEGEVVKRIDRGVGAIDRRAAQLAALVDHAARPAEAPDPGELAELVGRDRARWTSLTRQGKAARRERKDFDARLESARVELGELAAIRAELVAEGEDARQLWREAYALRAAIYTRARFGLFGSRPGADPELAEYAYADGPRLVGPGAALRDRSSDYENSLLTRDHD